MTTFGKHWRLSEERRRQISESMKGKRNALGVIRSEETRRKLVLSHANQLFSVNHRRKLSLARLGKKPWNTGIPQSSETRRRISLGQGGTGTTGAIDGLSTIKRRLLIAPTEFCFNKRFKDSAFHHMGFLEGFDWSAICIPRKLHSSNHHSPIHDHNMEQINRASLEWFLSESCGFETDRDVNSAIRVLNRGLEQVGLERPELKLVESGVQSLNRWKIQPLVETGIESVGSPAKGGV